MENLGNRIDASSLEALGFEARGLLCSSKFAELAQKFGYALAHGRDASDAILDALNESLQELGAASLLEFGSHPPPIVKYFKPNDTGLVALVECKVLTDNGSQVLLELIVIGNGESKYISVEQISAVLS